MRNHFNNVVGRAIGEEDICPVDCVDVWLLHPTVVLQSCTPSQIAFFNIEEKKEEEEEEEEEKEKEQEQEQEQELEQEQQEPQEQEQ